VVGLEWYPCCRLKAVVVTRVCSTKLISTALGSEGSRNCYTKLIVVLKRVSGTVCNYISLRNVRLNVDAIKVYKLTYGAERINFRTYAVSLLHDVLPVAGHYTDMSFHGLRVSKP